jgi:transposase
MRAYPAEIVKEAVRCYYTSGSYRKAQQICNIPKSTIHRWVKAIGKRAQRQAPKKRKRQVETVLSRQVTNLLLAEPFQTVATLQRSLAAQGLQASRSAVHRSVKKAGFSFKKAVHRCAQNLERCRERRRAFATTAESLPYQTALVSIDETSFDTEMFPVRGYSPKGSRLRRELAQGTRTRCTLILGVFADGRHSFKVVQGSANTASFAEFVQELPDASAGTTAILDNVAFHHSKRVLAAFQAKGYRVEHVPPYSPESNPVENVFSVLKAAYKRSAVRDSRSSRGSEPNFPLRVEQFVGAYLREKQSVGWRGPFDAARKAAFSYRQ